MFEKNKSLEKFNNESFDQIQQKNRELQELKETKMNMEEDERRLKLRYDNLIEERNKFKNEIEILTKKNEKAFSDNLQMRSDISKIVEEKNIVVKEV